MQMRCSFILVQITAKYMKCWISLLKILYILIQYFYRQVSFCRSHSHIFSISNLENHFMEQLFLLSLTNFFIVICNLPVLSFSHIVPFHRIIKQLFIYFFQIFILEQIFRCTLLGLHFQLQNPVCYEPAIQLQSCR